MDDEKTTDKTAAGSTAESPESTPESVNENAGEATSSENMQAEDNQIEKLQGDLAVAKDQNVRLLADFDNFRRRVARERNETYKNATEATITEFLPVMDNFERAIGQAPKEGDPFADGIRMVYDQLLAVFAKIGVEAINAEGAEFDPKDHEAIAYQPAPGTTEGTVIYQAKCGYRMGDKVIRPASVIVSSGDPNAAKTEEESAKETEKATDSESKEA